MNPVNRRTFLKTSAVAVTAGAVGVLKSSSVWAQPAGANNAIRLAIVGLNNKGSSHLKNLLNESDVRIAALCDVDPAVLAKATGLAKAKNVTPFTTNNVHEVLARSDVDAVLFATPNCWHALMTVWACQAGKDVYVEKPMCHTVWEGRKMIEAAARYNRIVQVGMQYSSEPGLLEAGKYIRSGALGKLQHVRAIYFAKRESIGRKFAWYPAGMDYDLYCGPSPVVPLERNQLHYDWHWMWATGNGDIGNNGVHVLGIAAQMSGQTTPPPRVMSIGGRYVIDDVAQTPNSMLTVYDYPIPIIFEQRNLPTKPGMKAVDKVAGIPVGVIATCEGGVVSGLIGAAAYDHAGKIIKKFAGDGGAGHMRNFLSAVRSRRAADLAAPTAFGHVIAGMCHFGNISYRLGKTADAKAIDGSLGKVGAAVKIAGELKAHLGVHGVDLARDPMVCGQWISTESNGDGIAAVESNNEADLARARYLLREVKRPKYTINLESTVAGS